MNSIIICLFLTLFGRKSSISFQLMGRDPKSEIRGQRTEDRDNIPCRFAPPLPDASTGTFSSRGGFKVA